MRSKGWKARGRAEEKAVVPPAAAAAAAAGPSPPAANVSPPADAADPSPPADAGKEAAREVITVGSRVFTASVDCIPNGYTLSSKTGTAVASGPQRGWFLLKRCSGGA